MLLRSSAASNNCAASGFVRPPAAAPASAPTAAQDRFRPSPSALAPPWRASALSTRIEVCRPTPVFRVWAFGLTAPTMPAADFWRFFPTPLDAGSPQANRQTSPGITHSPSRLCLSDLRHGVPCKYWALRPFARSPHRAALNPPAVRQASALPTASFRFHLAMDTLAVQLTLPLAGCVEDLHLLVISV
jgi:hypothetical protein